MTADVHAPVIRELGEGDLAQPADVAGRLRRHAGHVARLPRAGARPGVAPDGVRGVPPPGRAAQVRLHVDASNPTGAVGLYESVGMRAEQEWVAYELPPVSGS